MTEHMRTTEVILNHDLSEQSISHARLPDVLKQIGIGMGICIPPSKSLTTFLFSRLVIKGFFCHLLID